ncbi:hypothetical protein [Nonlabens ponticola]|uniref:hypothetical protein n=1 Tax=Nonlabens ponticola TaxID=2496866 RepID=UPI001F49933D|nr:hypothetical protein [Nonlabens ponticola]
MHKDEFKQRYWSKWLPKYDFPIILSTSDDLQKDYHAQGNSTGMDIFMTAGEMDALETTEEMIVAIKEKLKS